MAKTGIISFRYRGEEFTIESMDTANGTFFYVNNSKGQMIHNDKFNRMPDNIELRDMLDFYISDELTKEHNLNAHL